MKIFLVGFMGAGKTSVAKSLARELSLQAVDLDDVVVEKCNHGSIAELIYAEGESVFRDYESAALRDSIELNEGIISCGGGVVGRENNRLALQESNCTVIYLTASFSEIETRLSGDKSRPLFKEREKAMKLFEDRKEYYEAVATLRVDTAGKSVAEVVAEIVSEMVQR
jgi:shikimate kinase